MTIDRNKKNPMTIKELIDRLQEIIKYPDVHENHMVCVCTRTLKGDWTEASAVTNVSPDGMAAVYLDTAEQLISRDYLEFKGIVPELEKK